MKKIFFTLLVTISATQWIQAQEEGKFRAGLDLGYAMPTRGEGLFVAFEAKQNIADNMNVGLRIENAIFVKEVYLNDKAMDTDIIGNLSFIGTFDYYFNKNNHQFSPFVGTGIGYSSLTDVQFEFKGDETTPDAETNGKFGGLIRAGFEWGKLRVAANYNLLGKSKIEGGEIKNSYLGISLGFYIGGGKWNK